MLSDCCQAHTENYDESSPCPECNKQCGWIDVGLIDPANMGYEKDDNQDN